MNTTQTIARLMKSMTYDEVMEMAEWFSALTGLDRNGNEMDEPLISPSDMAGNLMDWADWHIEKADPRP